MSVVQMRWPDNGKEVEAEVGDDVVVELEENATTGFQWALDSYSDEVLELAGRDGADAPVGEAGAGGSSAVFRFNATSAGQGEIALKLWRGFEPPEAQLLRFTARVVVSG